MKELKILLLLFCQAAAVSCEGEIYSFYTKYKWICFEFRFSLNKADRVIVKVICQLFVSHLMLFK